MDEVRMRQTMLATLSNSKHIPNLSKATFEDWREKWLMQKMLLVLPEDIFDLTSAEFKADADETKSHERGRVVTFFAMVAQCGDKHKSIIRNCPLANAQALWRALHNEYRENTTANIIVLEKNFFNLSMLGSNLALKPFGQAVRDQAKILNEITGGDRISQHQEVAVYLAGLTEDFNSYRATILVNGGNLRIADVTKKVESYAQHAKIDYKTAPKSAENTFYVNERSSAGSRQDKTQICQYFKKTGKCRFGDKCRNIHVSGGLPHSNSSSSAPGSSQRQSSGRQNTPRDSRSTKFQGNCNHCGIKGHMKKDCFKWKAEQSRKQHDREQTTYIEVDEDFEHTFMLTTYSEDSKLIHDNIADDVCEPSQSPVADVQHHPSQLKPRPELLSLPSTNLDCVTGSGNDKQGEGEKIREPSPLRQRTQIHVQLPSAPQITRAEKISNGKNISVSKNSKRPTAPSSPPLPFSPSTRGGRIFRRKKISGTAKEGVEPTSKFSRRNLNPTSAEKPASPPPPKRGGGGSLL
mgnify:CR=1 FL=1